MDERSQTLLEFPLILARLATATSFPPSRRLAETLEPSTEPMVVARRLDETDQMRSLLEERAGVGIGAAHDIEPWVGRAVRGGRLEPAHFLEIADTLDATARLATSLADDRRPLIRDLGRDLHPLPAIRSTLARSFDPVGELLDTASPRLGGLLDPFQAAFRTNAGLLGGMEWHIEGNILGLVHPHDARLHPRGDSEAAVDAGRPPGASAFDHRLVHLPSTENANRTFVGLPPGAVPPATPDMV